MAIFHLDEDLCSDFDPSDYRSNFVARGQQSTIVDSRQVQQRRGRSVGRATKLIMLVLRRAMDIIASAKMRRLQRELALHGIRYPLTDECDTSSDKTLHEIGPR
jgi:hypothetical protein